MDRYFIMFLLFVSLFSCEVIAQDIWKEEQTFSNEFLTFSFSKGKLVIKNTKLFSTMEISLKKFSYAQFGKCIIFRILENKYIIITPSFTHIAEQFEYAYNKNKKRLLINNKLSIEIDTGIPRYISINEFALQRIKQKKDKELMKLRKTENQHALLRSELLKTSTELTIIYGKLQAAKRSLQVHTQKIKTLSPQTISLEKEVSTRIWQKSHYDELIKVAKQNLAYIHEKIKKDGKKFLEIRKGIQEDNIRLAKVIIEMGDKQNKLMQVKKQLKEKQKQLLKMTEQLQKKQDTIIKKNPKKKNTPTTNTNIKK